MPLAIAPEGAANGHSELVSPLASGAAQIGFWAMEDLVEAGREEDVSIVPIGIQYYYVDEPWERVESLIYELEQECGLTTEANLRMWHIRIVENFIAVTDSYVKDRPTLDRFAEITLLLWDLVAQIKGERSAKPPRIGNRRVQMTICNPLPLSDYWDRYQSGDRQARQATIDLTQELQTSMEGTLDRGW